MDIRACKAARMLLGWNQADLGAAAGISEVTVKRFESSLTAVSVAAVEKMQQAIENAGVEFLTIGQQSNSAGIGVRLKKRGLK